MKRIITPDFQIISEPVDSDHEDDWPTLLKVLKQALALYDEANLALQKRLQRAKRTNASTRFQKQRTLPSVNATHASSTKATAIKKLTALFRK